MDSAVTYQEYLVLSITGSSQARVCISFIPLTAYTGFLRLYYCLFFIIIIPKVNNDLSQ